MRTAQLLRLCSKGVATGRQSKIRTRLTYACSASIVGSACTSCGPGNGLGARMQHCACREGCTRWALLFGIC